MFLKMEEENKVSSLEELLYILDSKDISFTSNKTLKIIGLISNIASKESFEDIFLENNFKKIKDFGNFSLFKYSVERLKIYTYSYFDIETGMIFLFTLAKKSDEIPNIFWPLINKTNDIYHLVINPKTINSIADEYCLEKEGRITYFSGNYIPGEEKDSVIRPNYKRHLQYSGKDGYHTLKEMQYHYGILPKIINLDLGSNLQIRIDGNGIISFYSGRYSNLLPIINKILLYNYEVKKKINDSSKYELKNISASKSFERFIGIEYPWTIALESPSPFKTWNKILRITENEEWNFSYNNRIIDYEKRFLNANIVDLNKGNEFEIKIFNNEIKIYPIGRSDIGTNMRFFSFITQYLDFYAQVG